MPSPTACKNRHNQPATTIKRRHQSSRKLSPQEEDEYRAILPLSTTIKTKHVIENAPDNTTKNGKEPNTNLHTNATPLAKVYFIASRFDVKLQTDNPVRWDVAERLNHKQKTQRK